MRKGGERDTMDPAPATAYEPGMEKQNEQTVDLGPLGELTAFMVRLAQVQLYEAFFAEFGQRNIRPGQISILIAIGRNPGVRQGVLADALKIKWSNMAKIIRVLDEDGLIERRCRTTTGARSS